MDTIRTRVLAAVEHAADLAEQLAAARQDVVAVLTEASRAHQDAAGRHGVPEFLSVDRFDKELAYLLAGAGFVRPLFGPARPTPGLFLDVTAQQFSRRRDADTAAAFVKRWKMRVAHRDVAIVDEET